jgi:hypothetical protein
MKLGANIFLDDFLEKNVELLIGRKVVGKW